MDLNSAQTRAVEAPSTIALKIEAGAGTGKTSTLVNRYRKLMLEDGIPPERILALTFTRKAAAEMRDRIFAEIRKLDDEELFRALYTAPITNFHSFCHRFIWQDPVRFGIHPEFSVASEVEIARVRRALRRDFIARRIEGISDDTIDPHLTPGKLHTFFDNCFNIIERCRGFMMRPAGLLDTVTEEDVQGYRNQIDLVAAVWREYERRMAGRALVDFTGLIEAMVRALGSDPALREELAGRFDYILVDEFQDTSGAQNRLLQLLSGGAFEQVTVVGDEKQSIYRWRDARAENLREFKGASEPLTVNYRSRQEILDLAGAFLARTGTGGTPPLELQANRGPGTGAITIFHPLESDAQGYGPEAQSVSAWIRSLAAGEGGGGTGPLDYHEIAILLRSLNASGALPAIESELRRSNIPYTIAGATASLENSVLLSLQHLLTLMIRFEEPASVTSLLYLLEEKPFSFSDEELMKLFRAARDALKSDGVPVQEIDRALACPLLLSKPVISALGSGANRERCGALSALLKELRHRQSVLDFQSFVSELLQQAGVFLKLFDADARTTVVETVLETIYGIVDELIRKNEATASSLIEHLENVTAETSRSGAAEPTLPPGRVAIMTIHQAKGLEFTAVAVPGLRKKQAKGMSCFVSEHEGVFLGDFKKRRVANSDDARRYKEEINLEERCLVYVAMTRARDFLFLSSPEPGEDRDERKSNFFPDILACLADGEIEHQVWRGPPTGTTVPDRPARPAAGSDPDERALLRLWRDGVELAQRSAAGVSLPGEAIHSVTWRALAAFTACPLRYHFRYIRAVPADLDLEQLTLEPDAEPGRGGMIPASPVPGVDAARYGSFVHHILDRALDGAERAPAEIDALIRAEAHPFEVPEGSVDALARRVAPLVQAVLDDRAAGNTTVAHREQPFYLRHGTLLCTGIIDRIDRLGKRYWIVDYKTGEPKPEHHFQVRYYAWACSKLYGTRDVAGLLSYVRADGGVEAVDTGEEQLRKIESAVENLSGAVAGCRFEPLPGAVCAGCEFRTTCPHATS